MSCGEQGASQGPQQRRPLCLSAASLPGCNLECEIQLASDVIAWHIHFKVAGTCHQTECATGARSVRAPICVVVSFLCGYLEDEGGSVRRDLMTWWLWPSFQGRRQSQTGRLLSEDSLSRLPREVCEPGLSSQCWRNLAAHDRVRPAASPSPWLCCRETPLLFAPDIVFQRLMCYTEGKFGVGCSLTLCQPSCSDVHRSQGKPGEGAWLGANGHGAGARTPLLDRCLWFCWSPTRFQVASCRPGSLLSEWIPVGRRTTCSPQVSWVFKR